MGAFESAVEIILGYEGGEKITRDPHDPGGVTKYGISQKAHPDLDIENLSKAQAVEIYRKLYWVPIGADALPPGLALAAFDCAVNQGVGTARALLAKTKDLKDFMARRAEKYALLDQLDDLYALGWMRRCFDVYTRALQLNAESPPVAPSGSRFTF
jgi:hypothetical protein